MTRASTARPRPALPDGRHFTVESFPLGGSAKASFPYPDGPQTFSRRRPRAASRLIPYNCLLFTYNCPLGSNGRCPLFERPKRGRKKPHQPALAHVRSRRRAGPRCGGRLGSSSGRRIGRARRVILRTRSCVAQTSIRTAPRCAAWPPLAPHRERPGGGIKLRRSHEPRWCSFSGLPSPSSETRRICEFRDNRRLPPSRATRRVIFCGRMGSSPLPPIVS